MFFRNGYSELAFLCNGTDGHEIRAKNVSRCHLLNLNRRIPKIFPQGGDFALKPLFLGCFDRSVGGRPTGRG